MPIVKNTLILTALTCAFILSSFAQSQETGILVVVKDQFGDAIASAEVVLSGADQEEKLIKTDDSGIGRFSKIAAGEYRITVTAAGFQEYKSENIFLKNNETKRVEINLEIATFESNVEIGEDETVDGEKTGTTTVLGERQIENLPDNQEELERAIKRIGEAVAGEELPISVNGVQGGKIPPKQAIQQIRVNQNVFSAQYDSPFGGGIEIFTRANVDKFSGYVSFTFADARLNAADPFIGRRVPYQSRSYFFNLSGPLFGKKANFFVYGSHNESDLSQVINAIVLDDNLQAVEFQETFAAPSRSENVSLTINADPTKKHKLYLNYNFNTGRSKGQNVGGFSGEPRSDNKSQSHYLQLSDTFLVNANVVNQTRVLAAYFTNDNFGGSNEATINVLDAFSGGGSQQNSSNKTFRFDLSNETTRQMGKYAFGFGGRVCAANISTRIRPRISAAHTRSAAESRRFWTPLIIR